MRMKQKVSISSLPIHWGILILLIFIPQLLSAQENNDSIRIARDSVSMEPESVLQRSTLEIFPEKSTTYSLYPARQSEHMPRFSLKETLACLIRLILPFFSEVITAQTGYCINSPTGQCSAPGVRQAWQVSGVSIMLR